MVKRSLQASSEGIRKAKKAFQRKQWTQEYLAAQVGIATRQPIWRFFTGKPVDRYVFIEICFQLELQPEEIAAEPIPEETPANMGEEKALVKKARWQHRDKIKHQCCSLRLLDIARPVELADLFVDVNILETTTSQRWLDISDLENLNYQEFQKLRQSYKKISALSAVKKYDKLILLGKPGCGKTTLLQFIAMECIKGNFQADWLPIFIRLKNFAEDATDTGNFDFVEYIVEQCQFPQAEVENLLVNGQILILLDGLDEVSDLAIQEVTKNLRRLAEKFYKNQIIITCRTAAYFYKFQGFTEVEIADFTLEQIEKFAQNWFINLSKKQLKLATEFIDKLNQPENQPIRELVSNPLLLSLTCLVFQEKGDFPQKRSELYREGLELLLSRWDNAKGIYRDAIYGQLSLTKKIELLSEIAAVTFAGGYYFFESGKTQQIITEFLGKDNQLDSREILKDIETQHGILVEQARGIYSFSHLTFQEYLTARKIVEQHHKNGWENLTKHITEKAWREVFLLVVEMLPDAGELLLAMKAEIKEMTSAPKLQQYLLWLKEKTEELNTPYKKVAVRAFYFTLGFPPLKYDGALAIALDRLLVGEQTGELGLDYALNYAISLANSITPELFFNRYRSLIFALDFNHIKVCTPSLKQSLQQLIAEFPPLSEGKNQLKMWWDINAKTWIEKLTQVMIEERNFGEQWEFTTSEITLLKNYYRANQLLVTCLNRTPRTSAALKEEIEQTLLLPR